MNLDHVHLGSRDVEATRRFYETWFGFRFAFAIAEDFVFLTNDAGFLLAIAREEPAAFPAWFHVGFRQASAAEVRALHGRMRAAGLQVHELTETPARAAFGVSDPDGLGVEVFAEA